MVTKNVQQQQQHHVDVVVSVPAMVVAAMASPCPANKLLCCVIPLAFGFALGIAVAVYLIGSTTPAAVPGGSSLELFFPLPPPAAAAKLSAVRQKQQTTPSPEVEKTKTIKSQSWPADASGGNSTADQAAQRPVVASGFVDISDEELMKLAAAAPREVRAGGGGPKPKVAFLFLTRWDLPMAPLWDKFFEGHRGLYSVYVHSHPAFNGSDAGEASAFHRRTIPSEEVKWGQISMVEAERRLLAHALLDQSNARFLLLSESHVPLFDFPTVYSYLINSTRVYLESYDLTGATGRGRYKRGMSHVVTVAQWRKGSQWFEMDRGLSIAVVADDVYFPVFARLCRRNCYADEHYLPTFLGIRHPSRVANRSVTWVDWSHGGPHPTRFTRMEVTPDFLRWLRGGAGTTCDYNGKTTTVCFLFARKFLPNSLTRFLRFAPKVMGFG